MLSLPDKPAYTVQDIAALTGFSVRTVIRIFETEPGVLLLSRPSKMNKRRYRSIRIPRAVYLRVARRLSL
jgi:hypothetical protein